MDLYNGNIHLRKVVEERYILLNLGLIQISTSVEKKLMEGVNMLLLLD